MRCSCRRCETRGTVGTFHHSHEPSNSHETCQPHYHSGETRHQGEAENCRNENLSVSHFIGESAADGGEDSPGDTNHGNEISDRLIAQAQAGCAATGRHIDCGHAGKQRSDDPPIETHEAKAQAEKQHSLPFIIGIPFLRASAHVVITPSERNRVAGPIRCWYREVFCSSNW